MVGSLNHLLSLSFNEFLESEWIGPFIHSFKKYFLKPTTSKHVLDAEHGMINKTESWYWERFHFFADYSQVSKWDICDSEMYFGAR